MKKQNKIIVSTFIAFSSFLALNSTSLAQDLEYEDKIYSVNEEYKENLDANEENNKSLVNVSSIESNDKDLEGTNEKDYKDESIENTQDSSEDLKVEDNNFEENNFEESKDIDNKESEDFINNQDNEPKNESNDEKLDDKDEVKSDIEDKNQVFNQANTRIKENVEFNENDDKKLASFYRSSYSAPKINTTYLKNEIAYRHNDQGLKELIKNSWVKIGNDKYFTNSKGKVIKGIQRIGLDRFCFANNGKLKTNTKIITNLGAYQIGNSGIMNPIENRWIKVNNNHYHSSSDGKLDKGFTKVENNIHSFDRFGRLEKNKVFILSNIIYNIDDKGIIDKRRNNKTVIGKFEYTSDKFGNVISKKDLIKKPEVVTTYIQNGKGYKKYNNKNIKLARNSWIKSAGKDFRTDSNGYVMYGVHKIGNYYYNLTENGLAKDYKVYINNRLYDFDKSGKGVLLANNYKPRRDLDVTIGWMYQALNFNYKYDMGWPKRDKIGYADCSSAVYRAMKHGGFISQATANGNTETLFELGRRGKVLRQIAEKDIRYGDIFVAGVPGKSLGAGGHTGFILDKNTIIHCNWADRGVSVTPRKGRMGDLKYPVRYYRLVGGESTKYNI